MLQACSSIKKPYSTILQSPPNIIKTSVGNVEVWKWEPPSSITNKSKGDVYLIPGFPGSSLDNAVLAQKLLQNGYSIKLINPPGHGKNEINNNYWHFSFDQYARALYESDRVLRNDLPASKSLTVVAHSAGAEMVFKGLLLQAKKEEIPKRLNIVLINPWLPSISNYPIPWTEDDKNILKYSSFLIKLFGPLSKEATYARLFSDPKDKQNTEYLAAHEKLTEDLNGWGGFDTRFVKLLKSTTRSQKNILNQGSNYSLSAKKLTQLRKKLHLVKMKIIIINSSNGNDKIIPTNYKLALNKALKLKFPDINIRFLEIPKGGHMLQVEYPQQIIDAITR